MNFSKRILLFSCIFWSYPIWSLFFSTGSDPRILASDLGSESAAEADVPNELPLKQMWTAPDYSGQEQALGYGESAFKVPEGLEERVQFWINIYTKHSSRSGVLHDSRYVNLVYKSLDFSDIWSREDLTAMQRDRMIDKRIKEQKTLIELRLKRLQIATSSDILDEEELRLQKMFEKIDEPNKFYEASQKGRLRFQLGQSDIFKNGIRQSGFYIRQMEQIFKDEGMPLELTRMVFVESSFNLRARSRVGASGIWQFMRSTAKRYMRMDASVDERNDPLTATLAAARKLRQNYKMLEDWPLAVTGYNHGPYGILRLSKKLNSTNIADFVDFRKGSFGFASASFYASFLAALEVERRAGEFFGPIEIELPVVGTEYKLKKPLPIAKLVELFGGNLDQAKTFNPHVRSEMWKKKNGQILARNMIRLNAEALTKAREWSAFDQFMFSTRAM